MKKKLLSRVLSITLAALMLSSAAAVSQTTGFMSLTAGAQGGTEAPTEINSGFCGDEATYTLDSEGTLTVSGSGAIENESFSSNRYDYAGQIKSLVFEEGSSITSIGESAFCGVTSLESAVLPASLETIETMAFLGCNNLSIVVSNAADLDIKEEAFADTEKLQSAVFNGTGSLTLHGSIFGSMSGLSSLTINASSVRLHPEALKDCIGLAALTFTAREGTQIEGSLEESSLELVTVTPFSKIYTPAGKYFTGPSVAYDTYQPQYDHAQLYWEDTDSIVAAAEADEAGVRISNRNEKLEWLTNDNISSVFPGANAYVLGTMDGDGSFANPYLIYNPQNWRYLDFLARLGKLSSSYYGWDRGTNVKLMADLTLSDRDGTFTTLGGNKHREVHNSGYAYRGNFDGNGHTITLDVDHGEDDDELTGFGLFAQTDGAYIKNLHISGRMESAEPYTGLLVGYLANGHIYNCSSDAELVLSGTGEMKSGALVGYAYKPYIENCHFTGKILGGDEITAVGGFIGQIRDSGGGETLKNCYFAPSQISVSSEGSCILYRPYYGSYAGWCGFVEIENNYYNAEALKLNGDNMGGLDQGASDAEGIDSLNETEFWDNGQLTMPKATAQANPGTRHFAYTGGEHRIFMDLQADAYHYLSSQCIIAGDSFPYMPGYAHNGVAYYKANDGDWSATPPLATEVGEYTVYYRVAGDACHRDSDIQSIQVTIEDENTLPGSGTPADPYTISNDLEWSIFCDMRDTDGKYFKLVNDIVVSENRQSKRGPNHPLEFNGFFDGDGHTITLYYVSRGTSDSLFGKLIGIWSYDTSSYKSVCIKNLIVNGVMYSGGGENSPIAYEITHNATVSNIISNMTIVNGNAGGDRSVSGIVNTGSLSGGVHFFNCKVGGKFSASGGDITFAGLTNMNDFWQSGTDFLVKDCYVNPTCEDIKVSDRNFTIMGNYVEGKSTIENTFFGQSILSIIPVDEETGETTNTQGISDENGLAALYETGYWADGNPTMPRATFNLMPVGKTFIYAEEETTVHNPDTDEDETAILPVQHQLIIPGETDDGTFWYRTDGGAWSTEVPTAAAAGKHTIECKIAGDYLHRDSEPVTLYSYITYGWTIPTGLTVTSVDIPYNDYGSFGSDTNAKILVEWDDNIVNSNRFTMTIISPDGQSGTYFEGAPVGHDAWFELGGEKPAVRFFVGLLGDDEEQIFEDGTVNGAKYGDTVVITAAGVIMIDGDNIESPPCEGVDFMVAASNAGTTFPVLQDAMSNDSALAKSTIVLDDTAVIEALASGGKAPYQFEVSSKHSGDQSCTVLQSYEGNSVVKFVPDKVGEYTIHVNAKDSEDNIVGKDLALTVNKHLENLSTISESVIVKGESLTVNAAAEGGIAPYSYKVTYKLSGSEQTVTVQDYSTNAKVSFAPESAGSFSVTVGVKDARDVVVNRTFEVTVNKPLANNSTISETAISLGSSVTLTAASEGGLEPIQYAFVVQDTKGKWSVLKNYSSDTTCGYTPAAVGNYTLQIKAKDSRGTVVISSFRLTVVEPIANTSTVSKDTIILGESVTITASSTGGVEPSQYAFSVKDTAGNWTVIKDYSADTSCTYEPPVSGDYTIMVRAKDNRGAVSDKEFALKVVDPLTNSSTISAQKIVIGNSVTLTAVSTGGLSPVQYAYVVKDNSGKWTVIKNYSDAESCSYTPAATGSYLFQVKAKDAMGTVSIKEHTLTVVEPLTNSSVLSEEIITIGKSVELTAISAGGIAPVQYAYVVKNTKGSWSVIKNYSDAAACTYTPPTVGSYTLQVKAKDSAGTVVIKEFALTVMPELSNTSSVSAETIVKGKSATLTGAAEGGIAPYQFAYVAKSPEGKVYTLKDYSNETSYKFTPAMTGVYTVQIKAKDTKGTVKVKEFALSVMPVLENTSSCSAEVIVKGSSVTLTGASTGGLAPVQYAYVVKDTSGKWSVIKNYSDAESCSYTPSVTGSYLLQVKAKDSEGTVKIKEFQLTVVEPLANNSLISDEIITIGSSIELTAVSSGGIAPVQYAYVVKDTSGKWSVIKNYSDAASCGYTPSTVGTYTLQVKAKDSAGTVKIKEFALSVMPELENSSVVSADTVVNGRSVTLNGAATGGIAPYQFAYVAKNPEGKWYILRNYSSDTEFVFAPAMTGSYTIRIKARDTKGTVRVREFELTVTPPLANRSMISDTTVPQGGSVSILAAATGGTAHYQFAYVAKDPSGKWTVIKNYSADTVCDFAPSATGRYAVQVKAKDSSGTVRIKEFALNVTPGLENTSTLSADNMKLGGSVTLTGSATGGTGAHQFAFVAKTPEDEWLLLKSYSADKQCTFTPEMSGSFLLQIKVRDEDGTVKTKEFAIEVTD